MVLIGENASISKIENFLYGLEIGKDQMSIYRYAVFRLHCHLTGTPSSFGSHYHQLNYSFFKVYLALLDGSVGNEETCRTSLVLGTEK